MRIRTNRSAAATVVKNAASVAARLFSVAAVNGVRMLIDASISRPMRRPGNDSCAADERRVGIGERQDEEPEPAEKEQQRDVPQARAKRDDGHRSEQRRQHQPVRARPAARHRADDEQEQTSGQNRQQRQPRFAPMPELQVGEVERSATRQSPGR